MKTNEIKRGCIYACPYFNAIAEAKVLKINDDMVTYIINGENKWHYYDSLKLFAKRMLNEIKEPQQWNDKTRKQFMDDVYRKIYGE